jgi:hypothetical protein
LNPPDVTDQSGRGSAEFIPVDANSQVIVLANFGGVSSSASPVQAQVITSFDSSRGLPSITISGIVIPMIVMLTLFVVLIVVYMGYSTRLAAGMTEMYEKVLARFGSSPGTPESPDGQGE